AQATPPLIEEAHSVAHLRLVPRPRGRLVCVKIRRRRGDRQLKSQQSSEISSRDGGFERGKVRHAKFQQTVGLEETPRVHPGRGRTVGWISAEAADIHPFGV